MKFKYLAAAMLLSAMSLHAYADDQSIVLSQTSPGMFSGSFMETHLQSGLIVDSFSFSLPGGSSAALGDGSLSFTALSGTASLVLATLVDAVGNEVDSPPDPSSIAIPSTLAFTGFSAPLTLTVVGSAGDPFADPVALTTSYEGTIAFGVPIPAVPEPGNYGLLSVGLLCLAFFIPGRAKKRVQ